jgi:putative ABC transport system permease protein
VGGLRSLVETLGLRPLRRHAGRTLLTLLGVSAGVAVTIGIDLAARASIRSFSESARDVAGPARLRVHHRPLALPESLLQRLTPFEEVADLHPVLEAGARADSANGTPFTILGIDIVGDPRIADRATLDAASTPAPGGAGAADPFATAQRLFDPGLLYVPASFAQRIAPRSDSLDVVVGTRSYRFRVVRFEPAGGAAPPSTGVAFLDLAPFQERFGRRGELDWIDVEPHAGTDPATLRGAIAGVLSGDLIVEAPEERALSLERMLSSYRRNLRALSLVSLVVGMLLAYNALLASVLQRREEISMLRALGAPRRLVLLLIGIEGVVVGIAGGLIGVALGRGLAVGALALVSRTIGDLYARSAPTPISLSAGSWIVGVGLGLATAAVAAFGPMRHALRVRPLEFARSEHFDAPEPRPPVRRLLLAAAAAGLALWLIAHPDGFVPGLRIWGYVGAGAALLAGSLVALPAFTLLVRAARPLLSRVWTPVGRLAVATALASRRRLGVSVAALLLAYSIVWGMASLVESFRATVDAWAGATLRADLWVTPQSRAGSPAEGTMPAAWRERLAALPGLADVDAFRIREISIGEDLCFLGAFETAVLARNGFLPLVGGGDARPILERMPGRRIVMISEPLARRRGFRAGGRLALDTPSGRHEYAIAAIYRDYSSDRGYAVMDRSVYLADFRDSLVSTYALFVRPGVPRDQVGAAAARALGPGELIRVTDAREIREEVRRVMRRTFAVTDALEIVAAIVALLSVLGTLAALALERTREIGVLRAIGAARIQIVRALLLEGALLALAGLILGGLTGSLLSAVLVHVLNRESFGWTLTLATPWGRTLLLAGILFVAALLAALLPARRAAGIAPREAMSRG